jgi:hypothetical protein
MGLGQYVCLSLEHLADRPDPRINVIECVISPKCGRPYDVFSGIFLLAPFVFPNLLCCATTSTRHFDFGNTGLIGGCFSINIILRVKFDRIKGLSLRLPLERLYRAAVFCRPHSDVVTHTFNERIKTTQYMNRDVY